MKRTVRILSSIGAAFFASSLLMAQGDVSVVVNWPSASGAAHVVRMSDASGSTWVVVGREDRSIKLVNFPAAWNFNVSPTTEKRSSISVSHGESAGIKILITGYSGDEKLTESVLDHPGESAELMLTRCSIKLLTGI
jgi:hypothetical protein